MRFTIRDLLWLMVVVGLAVAWWIDRSRERAPLIHSHMSLQELRQFVGDKSLNHLIEMAKARNRAPVNPIAPNTVVINLPNRTTPTNGKTPAKAGNSN